MDLRGDRGYPYMKDLLELETVASSRTVDSIPPILQGIHTPLVVQQWKASLAPHPDKNFSQYITQGLQHGFHIGMDASSTLKAASVNMQLALQNPDVIRERLSTECKAGRVIGPLPREMFSQVHVSRFGVIPKKHQPGKWRMIIDMSSPKGHSVNDGISRDLCSLSYASVDDAVKIVKKWGNGTELAKFDLENAYRLIPVHPSDRILLGMEWEGQLFVDTALPFGLRSAPKIFSAVADGLQSILEQQGAHPIMHYLDDFLVFGAPGSDRCKQNLEMALKGCRVLGVPVAPHKTEGPSTTLVFLGIELDTVKQELRLPIDKLGRLQQEIKKWTEKRATTKRELLSLIGQLQHACCVVKPGRSFLRRMISLSTIPKQLHHRVRLNREFRSDLRWWSTFLASWNGVGMMSALIHATPTATITSDASGNWGCGAFNNHGEWFQLQWPEVWLSLHITVKELLPIVLGLALWGVKWRGQTILCKCDNAAVVAIIRSGVCRDPTAMNLIRNLFFISSHFNVQVITEHIPGVVNTAADALSRDNLPLFKLQCHQAKGDPTPIPETLYDMLVRQLPDRISDRWTILWHNFSLKAKLHPHRDPTGQAKNAT